MTVSRLVDVRPVLLPRRYCYPVVRWVAPAGRVQKAVVASQGRNANRSPRTKRGSEAPMGRRDEAQASMRRGRLATGY